LLVLEEQKRQLEGQIETLTKDIKEVIIFNRNKSILENPLNILREE